MTVRCCNWSTTPWLGFVRELLECALNARRSFSRSVWKPCRGLATASSARKSRNKGCCNRRVFARIRDSTRPLLVGANNNLAPADRKQSQSRDFLPPFHPLQNGIGLIFYLSVNRVVIFRETLEALRSVLFPAPCQICDSMLTNVSLLPISNGCLASLAPFQGPCCATCGRCIRRSFAHCRNRRCRAGPRNTRVRPDVTRNRVAETRKIDAAGGLVRGPAGENSPRRAGIVRDARVGRRCVALTKFEKARELTTFASC